MCNARRRLAVMKRTEGSILHTRGGYTRQAPGRPRPPHSSASLSLSGASSWVCQAYTCCTTEVPAPPPARSLYRPWGGRANGSAGEAQLSSLTQRSNLDLTDHRPHRHTSIYSLPKHTVKRLAPAWNLGRRCGAQGLFAKSTPDQTTERANKVTWRHRAGLVPSLGVSAPPLWCLGDVARHWAALQERVLLLLPHPSTVR